VAVGTSSDNANDIERLAIEIRDEPILANCF
jgi:hypothetical protein